MQKVNLFELESSRKRLHYYVQMKERNGAKAPKSLSKWIEIYSERVARLEKQATKLQRQGLLRTAIGKPQVASKSMMA